MDIISELSQLSNKVETARLRRERAQGRMEELNKQMQEQGISSVDELCAAVKDLEVRRKQLQDELAAGVAEFKEKYPEFV